MKASQPDWQGHLSNDLLVRALDGELSGSEILAVETHLSSCAGCQERQAELRLLSDGLSTFVQSQRPGHSSVERVHLVLKMEESRADRVPSRVGQTLARFGWVLAAAATLAVGVTYLPFRPPAPASPHPAQHVSQAGLPFEVDGETFVSLPYSNPDLPMGGSHIVQMQVPISSLADAGVLVEPLVNQVASPDRAVLADVLLGLDGQPLGVHVLALD